VYINVILYSRRESACLGQREISKLTA